MSQKKKKEKNSKNVNEKRNIRYVEKPVADIIT